MHICQVCGFEAENGTGLSAHVRAKHNTPEVKTINPESQLRNNGGNGNGKKPPKRLPSIKKVGKVKLAAIQAARLRAVKAAAKAAKERELKLARLRAKKSRERRLALVANPQLPGGSLSASTVQTPTIENFFGEPDAPTPSPIFNITLDAPQAKLQIKLCEHKGEILVIGERSVTGYPTVKEALDALRVSTKYS